MTSVGIPHSVAAALPTLSVFDITNEISRDVASAGVARGIAYVTAGVPSSLVRSASASPASSATSSRCSTGCFRARRADRERMLLALLGPRTEQIPFEARRLCLGQWQRVLLFCFDGKRARRLHPDAAGMNRALLAAATALILVPGATAAAPKTTTIGTRGAVESISADGGRVAIHAVLGDDPRCDFGAVWQPARNTVIRLGARDTCPQSDDAEFDAVTLSGNTAVWTNYNYGNHAYCVGRTLRT